MDSSDEKLAKLRSDVGRGRWPKVFETYVQEGSLRTAKITGTGDTVLHMAVSNGQEKMVANMVNLLVLEENKLGRQNNVTGVTVVDNRDCEESWNMKIVLGWENDRKNTPLHLAATMGNVEMCGKIAGADPSLIARRNIDGETPIFVAALNGRKAAFLWLHYLYMSWHGVSSTDFAHCIRDNGDTILHCAIAEEHFDVAIEIVHLYKDLVRGMKRNKEGLSPLHLLASKRSAFKSTALLELSILSQPIYWFSKVEEKNQATTLEELQKCPRVMEAKIQLIYKRIWWHHIQKMKENHTWSLQIMNELLQYASDEDMSQIISRTASEQLSVSLPTQEDNEECGTITIETPLMIAAKNGIIEMVEKILKLFSSTIKDVNAEGKNILLLAVEYRQTEVFRFLCKQNCLSESDLFRQVDKDGNSALHLAASLGVELDWLNPGEALSILREINWFEFVKESMPYGLLERCNRKMETPEDVFRKSHKELMKSEGKWAAKTSQACSVVSTLVASVAFATRTSVPGGYDTKGDATLRSRHPVFKVFVISSLLALFFSIISTICFLSIAASRPQSVRSWRYIPSKLYFGMYFMFVSIICLWISFCAADFFTLDDDDKKLDNALPSYVFLSLGIMVLVVTQLPTFLGPILSCIWPVPAPRRKATRPIQYRKPRNGENGTDLNLQN